MENLSQSAENSILNDHTPKALTESTHACQQSQATPKDGHGIAETEDESCRRYIQDLDAPSHPTPRLSFRGRDVQQRRIQQRRRIHLEFCK